VKYHHLLFILLFGAASLAAQTPPKPKQVPPPGVAIPDADRKELEAGVAELGREIEAIDRDARARPLLPDVEVFHKAVDWPLRYNEFFDVKQVATARALLAEGMARAKALRGGQAPWTTATGLVVRGYRSRVDGSAQPYGLEVPATWKAEADRRPRRLDVFNHGRNEKLTELAFISERMKKPGEFQPADAFVLHPYGRFCNATKFAGETDVFEALEHVRANYPIDGNRIVMMGFSMGGASTWHLAAHHAGLWMAASPGAGFAETATYLKVFAEGKTPPPWWEQVLWRLYDADDSAANLANCPVLAYSGEEDPQIAASDLMEKAMAAEGLKLERFIGPKTGHKYEPETRKALAARLDEIAQQGREEIPAKVRLVTFTLKYNRQEWVITDALEKHWERAEINAEIVDEGTIHATTRNVAALTFEMRGNALPLDKTQAPRVVIDGQELTGPPVANPWVASFRKSGARWERLGPGGRMEKRGLGKIHNLQGPIDDAFTDSFVFVTPTGQALNETSGKWTQSEIARAVPQWRTVFRGEARVVDDGAITPELIETSNLVLWGDPSSNALLAKILPRLPLKWNADEIEFAGTKYPAATHVPILIFPNPLNPRRYVVLNSSFTFRQGSNASNATQTPKLPDWAIVDLRTPPSDAAPGLVVNAGFFGEAWEVTKQ
jgi:dienelactone hydrolase